MKWCIETEAGEVFEVTRLLTDRGERTDDLYHATACVIKLDEHAWLPSLIEDRTVHRLQ